MLPLAAYADRLSVRPGSVIRFCVANATGAPVQARVERVICADANPAGPGIRTEKRAAELAKLCEPGPQRSPQGSYGAVEDFAPNLSWRSFGVMCRVFPTLATESEQVLLSCFDAAAQCGFVIYLDARGALCARLGLGTHVEVLTVAQPLALRRWHSVCLSVDGEGGRARLSLVAIGDPLASSQGEKDCEIALAGSVQSPVDNSALLMAAGGPRLSPDAHFTGKLEDPVVLSRAVSATDGELYLSDQVPATPLAAWDFGQNISTSTLVDVSGAALNGKVINSPGRGMTGSNWHGEEMRYTHAPELYGAIHFHADDLVDCCWPVAFEWQVPADTSSGIYAVMFEAGDARENVPFHVVPPKGKRTADIAVLASTLTYTIYGNHARLEWDVNEQFRNDWRAQAAAWNAYEHNPGDHREYGLSTYNDHVDGSGISVASWHRPMLNVRVGYITYPQESVRASGLRHFPADTHLTAWLEAQGFRYDVITDWELHTEGLSVLEDYPVVMTGSHPEYHTRPMLDALVAYRNQGGRLCYMGGNGFYWKIAANPERDGVIEIRRGEGGIRAWAAEPGEYYNQFDGEYGGMWRRNGRPPQDLCGVGFTAQGNFAGSYYRKRAEANDPRVAWMFAGVDADLIGDHGLSGHGAAGFELDRADKLLGTPRHALVVASSENHPPEVPWVLVPEEMLTHLSTWSGEPAKDLIRADMTFFEGPRGGAVFSTGSITFCGSLVTNNFDNDISRLVANVLNRFLDSTPFEIPDS